jgi:uncharacterized membrane protein YhiD involved in acid resistance
MEIVMAKLEWVVFLIKITLAISCGFAIGFGRETMRKPAGVKTHTLICLGSCLFTHFSFVVQQGDPTRIAAQIVSGVGFIGAGTILQSKHRIEGLTSAALVFVNAAIGMMIGGRLFLYSIVSTIALLILFQFLRKHRFHTKLYPYQLIFHCNQYKNIQFMVDYITFFNAKITKNRFQKHSNGLEAHIVYFTTPLINHRILSKINELKSVHSIKHFQ